LTDSKNRNAHRYLQFADVHIEPSLIKSNKSSSVCRSAEGAISGQKKLSTVSLHGENEGSVVNCNKNEGDHGQDDVDAPGPLVRRNSIHNVPYVDVNDPDTRARMELYKEERRLKLRAQYKVEDYRTEKQQ
jgi:hypothetical protein